MMKRRILAGFLAALVMLAAGCGQKKILHCDHCGKEVQADAGSNMEEDWIIFCGACEKELFPDGLVN